MIDKIGSWVSFICACMIFSLTVAIAEINNWTEVAVFGVFVGAMLVGIYMIKLWKGF